MHVSLLPCRLLLLLPCSLYQKEKISGKKIFFVDSKEWKCDECRRRYLLFVCVCVDLDDIKIQFVVFFMSNVSVGRSGRKKNIFLMVSHSLEKKKEAKRRSACISFLFSRVEQQQQQQQLLRVVICLAWPALLGNRQTKRVEGGKTARPCLVDFRHHDGRPTSCLLHLLLFTQSKLISFEKILTNFPR